ncbi:MAG: hypothetical protein ACRDN0_14125 [Trebonia sp.]
MRSLLWERAPGFAAALAVAEQRVALPLSSGGERADDCSAMRRALEDGTRGSALIG